MNNNIAVIKEEKDIVYKSITLSFRNPKDLKEFRKLLCDFDEDIDTQNLSEITYLVSKEGCEVLKHELRLFLESKNIETLKKEHERFSKLVQDIEYDISSDYLEILDYQLKISKKYIETIEKSK